MSPLYKERLAARAEMRARADEAFDRLVESLEIIQDAAAWASDFAWSQDTMRKYLADIRSDLGEVIETVLELQFFGEAALPGADDEEAPGS